MSEDNVVEFRRRPKTEPPDRAELAFTVYIYEDPDAGYTTTVVEQPDRPDGTVDIARYLDVLYRSAYHTEDEHFESTGDIEHQLLAITRIYQSSAVTTKWDREAFETPKQLRWLRRRLNDAYWHMDERRGFGWHWHLFCNWLTQTLNRLKGARR